MDLSALFQSSSIAVVGASRDPQKVGHQLLKNLLCNTSLHLYPVNPKAEEILGKTSYSSLTAIQENIDLVIIAVPISAVESIIDECVIKKVKAVVIITAGFAEEGEAGKVIQHRITSKLLQSNIALLGPNTMGFINPYKNMYASFGAEHVEKGSIAVISQSGAILSALFQSYASAYTGVSFAVSMGNKGGLSELECLKYAGQDPHTNSIALYLESFADLPLFMKIAKQISQSKPIFLLKGGMTHEGIRAAISHTAALATPQALLIDAAEQSGIVLIDTFEQFVRATIAASQTTYLPEHLMIVTNAGGPAVVTVDEASLAHIPLSVLSTHTTQALAHAIPHITPHNPLDLLGDASAQSVDKALTVLAQDPQIDAVAILITQQSVTDMNEVARVLSKPRGKKVRFISLIGGEQLEPYRKQLTKSGAIVTNYPNEIVETLQALMRARQFMHRSSLAVKLDITLSHPFPKTFEDLQTLLEQYGLTFPHQKVISTKQDVSQLASLSTPLIAKTTDLELKHKAKLGAVIGNVCDLNYAKTVFDHLQTWKHPVVFQEMIANGREALIGFTQDPQFGWYLAIGIGGSMSDAIADRAYCFLPASEKEVLHAVKKTRLSTILTPIQTLKLVQLLLKLQTCVLSTQDLKELEINPLFITGNSMIVADIKRG